MSENPAAERYRQRRQQLMTRAGEGLILINASGPTLDPSLPDRNLYYLTGIQDTSAWLLLAPDGIRVERVETLYGPEMMRGRVVREILFIQPRTPFEALLDGAGESLSSLQAATGVERVYDRAQLEAVLADGLLHTDTLWLNTPTMLDLRAPVPPQNDLARRIQERYYWVRLRNIAPLVHDLRRVKDTHEIACLRRAFEVHTEIFTRIMQALRPGEYEALGSAIFQYELGQRPGIENAMGASALIVGAGRNTAVAHYTANDQQIKDGDLILIDGGVAVEGYASDITRTFPANGKFTPRQRELYAIVLEAQYAGREMLRPGSSLLQAHQAVYRVFEKHNLAQYSFGMCGHPVGLNIHDSTGRSRFDRDQPFEGGEVVVLEPFLVLPHEGLGIRIEDGFVITEQGCEALAGPPREIADVEALCRRD